MNELIETQVIAIRIACGQMTTTHLKALQDSVDQACRVPAAFAWDRKVAAHAEIFNVLADGVDDPLVAAVLSSGVGLAYDLTVAAGRTARPRDATRQCASVARGRANSGARRPACPRCIPEMRRPGMQTRRMICCHQGIKNIMIRCYEDYGHPR